MANNNLYKRFASYFLLCIAVVLLLSGCAQDEVSDPEDNQKVLVPVEISGINLVQTKALGDPTHTVDRILILPFKKTDENASNDDYNFILDYASVVQFDVNSFAYSTMLSLPKSVTYKIMVIGYGRNDYDWSSRNSNTGRFQIYSVIESNGRLDFVYLYANVPNDVPEIFTAAGTAYNDAIAVGESFKAEQINKLTANLTRAVSGISLSISNVPSSVKSVTLITDHLVSGMRLRDRFISGWVSQGGIMILDTKAPVAGKITFSKYLLPMYIYQDASTKLYLDIMYNDNTTRRYTVKVPDVAGLSSANNITFAPNNMVFISGDYLNMDIGFQIQYAINLDDDIWDGITTN